MIDPTHPQAGTPSGSNEAEQQNDVFRELFADVSNGSVEEFYEAIAWVARAMTHYDFASSRLTALKIKMEDGDYTCMKARNGFILAIMLQVLRTDSRLRDQMGEDDHDRLSEFVDNYMTNVYSVLDDDDLVMVKFKIKFVEGLSLGIQYETLGDIAGLRLIF